MPVQTANTLFRFTTKLPYLLKALANGFSPRLSKEVSLKGDYTHYPMVCFCDIPLTMADNHMSKYGDYGIGLTKEWGIKNGLNPILYYNKESILIDNFFRLVNEGVKAVHKLYGLGVGGTFHDVGADFPYLTVDHSIEGYSEKNAAYAHAVNRLVAIQGLERYFKPRVGEYYIGDKHYSDYHFYDEREWRYLPYNPLFDPGNPHAYEQDNAYDGNLNDEEKEEMNFRLEKEREYILNFTVDDIKYIIVKEEDEVISVVNHLKLQLNLHGNPYYSPEEIMLLTSRILTKEQIREDF